MRGLFLIDRALVDHHIVGVSNPRRFAAWIWMLSQASWKPNTVFLNRAEIKLERGQFACSIRHMAEKVGMTKKEAEGFIELLERCQMVTKKGTPRGTPKGTGATVITICNYEKYQNVKAYRATLNETPRGHRGDTEGTPRGHDRIPDIPDLPDKTFDDVDDDARASAAQSVDGAAMPQARAVGLAQGEVPTLREKILTAVGADPTSGIAGAGVFLGTQSDMHQVQRWQDDLGLTEAEILAQIAEVMVKARQKKPTFTPSRLAYFDRPMAELAGAKAAPRLAAVAGQIAPNNTAKPLFDLSSMRFDNEPQ